MSTFNWSTTGFPNPTRDLSVSAKPAVERTTMDSGRPRQVKKFTTSYRSMRVRWQLTDAQWGLFQGVLAHKLNMGADWFLINLPTGDGIKECLARFVNGSWDAKHTGVMEWDVTATLDVGGASPLTASEVDALLSP